MPLSSVISSDPDAKKKKSLERETFPRGREIMCSQCWEHHCKHLLFPRGKKNETEWCHHPPAWSNVLRGTHAAPPVAKTSQKGKKGRHHNLSEPLTATLCFSSARIYSAVLHNTNCICHWGESWKNWGHPWDWNLPFPQCLLWRDLRSLWGHHP